MSDDGDKKKECSVCEGHGWDFKDRKPPYPPCPGCKCNKSKKKEKVSDEKNKTLEE